MLAKLAIKLSPQKDGFSQALKVFLGARRTWMCFFVEVYYFWTHVNFEDHPFSGAILVLGGVFEIFCLFGDFFYGLYHGIHHHLSPAFGNFFASACFRRRKNKEKKTSNFIWLVVFNSSYVHPYLGKWSILTNIFQRGWNHQLVIIFLGKGQGVTIFKSLRGWILEKKITQNLHLWEGVYVSKIQPMYPMYPPNPFLKKQWSLMLHPWNLKKKKLSLKRKIIFFRTSMIVFHVKFPGCK